MDRHVGAAGAERSHRRRQADRRHELVAVLTQFVYSALGSRDHLRRSTLRIHSTGTTRSRVTSSTCRTCRARSATPISQRVIAWVARSASLCRVHANGWSAAPRAIAVSERRPLIDARGVGASATNSAYLHRGAGRAGKSVRRAAADPSQRGCAGGCGAQLQRGGLARQRWHCVMPVTGRCWACLPGRNRRQRHYRG